MLSAIKTASALLAGASYLVIAQAAAAQDTAPAPAESAAAQETPAGAGQADIVVTGSRTIRNGNASPTPVTVISTESLTNVRPTSLTESVNVLPVFSGSRGQVSNPSATGGVGGGNGNAAQLNLRNIGSLRTLVLMDGRRVPPTSNTNIVDADVIPQLLVDRVDVVTGGVSAVYGSDAVSGVVNFILNKNFNGIRAQGSYGISQENDGQQLEFGIAYGTPLFGGRGHFEASYQFRDDKGVLARSDRDWFTRPTVVASGTTGTAGSAANPWTLIENTTLANLPFGGRITCGNATNACAISGQYFATNGVLSAFANGTATGTAGIQIGGAGGYNDLSLKSAQRMHQMFGRFDFDLTDDIKFFAMGSGNFKKNSFFAEWPALQNIAISRTNAFVNFTSQLPAAVPTFTISETFNQAERFNGVPKTDQYMGAAGLNGKFGSFDWNVAYTYGYAKLATTLRNNVNNQKLAAATDAVLSGGQIVCNINVDAITTNNDASCAPLNLLGPTAASAAAIDYILDDTLYVAKTRQHDVVADISGSPFETWAGPVTVALSGEWRRQSFNSTSEATPDQFLDCAGLGLRFNCTARNVTTGAGTMLYRNTFAASPPISQSVWEVAGEATVPLLRDVTLVKSFDVNGAVRYTKYNTVGSYWTWKAGADWHVTDDLRFRGTLSRDIRAPTLNDLFAPTFVVTVTNQDITTTATTGQKPSVNLSNSSLTAEIGNTMTVGTVYRPSFVPGLSFAVDYYEIEIKNAITTVQGFQATTQQGCLTGGIALYCDLIVRNADGTIREWRNRPINLSVVKTSGVDFEVNYNGRLGGQPLTLRGLAAYQPHIRYIQPGVPTLDQGGVAFGPQGLQASPSWRLTGLASYKLTDTLRIDLMHRWRNKLKLSGSPTDFFVAGQGTMKAYHQTSLNVAWQVDNDLAGKPELFLNVQNLFNTKPPLGNATNTGAGTGGFGGFATTDDPIGRYFTAGARVRF